MAPLEDPIHVNKAIRGFSTPGPERERGGLPRFLARFGYGLMVIEALSS